MMNELHHPTLQPSAHRTNPGPDVLWRTLLGNPDLTIAVIDILPGGELRVSQANAGAAMFAKMPIEEVAGQQLSDSAIPEVAGYLANKIRICAEAGHTLAYERAVDLPSGRQAWATNLTPLFNDEGRVAQVIAVSRPIPFEMLGVGIAERDIALVESLQLTAPGVIYLLEAGTLRNRFIGGQSRLPLGYKPYEIEEMDDPIGTLVHPDDHRKLLAHLTQVSRLPDGEVRTIEFRARHRDGHYLHFSSQHMVFSRDADGAARFLFGVANDISEERRMQGELRELLERQASLRAEEQRQIAQALHDSTGQHIVAAGLALARIQAAGSKTSRQNEALSEVMKSLKEAEREIRILTYLLHPPAIRDRGLGATLRTFVSEFASRAGIKVEVCIDESGDTVPDRLAVPLLRACQEALTNVHRHAKARSVSVRLQLHADTVTLAVSDDGIGFDETKLTQATGLGVGLSGMQERMERLGGTLAIHSDAGTNLVVTIPLDGDLRRG